MTKAKEISDSDLLSQISVGDESAFAYLVRKYSHQVFNFATSIVASKELAEEITNDIFVQLWLKREKLIKIDNLSAYLYTAARNQSLNQVKKMLREKKNLNTWQADYRPQHTDAHQNKALGLIDKALEQLSEQQRRCWLMSRRMELSYEEIQKNLGISRNTVKTHIQAANAAIKAYVLKHIELSILVSFFMWKD